MNPQPDHATAPAVIEIRKFSYSYQGASRRAVDDLSFTVGHGEIFGFLGPSGAGKSTTQNVLIGLLSGYRGSISVLSRDLKEWDRSYYQRIGVAFEAPNHYSKLTALENLRLFAALYDAQSEDAGALLDFAGTPRILQPANAVFDRRDLKQPRANVTR